MANGIWVVAEQRDGKLKKSSFEGLKAAKQVKAALNQPIAAVLMGKGVAGLADELAAHGAESVIVVEHDMLKDYNTDAYAKALTDLIKAKQPEVVIGSATPIGLDLFPRVAARCDTAVMQDCMSFKVEGGVIAARRPVYSGKAHVDVSVPSAKPQMMTIRLNAVGVDAPASGASANVENAAPALGAGDVKVRLVEVQKGQSEKVDLTEADKIVSGGRAMKDAANFKILWELAEAIGSGTTVGASRAAVDSGYAPHDMQVGQTGKTVNPSLYMAFGISGAIQHLAGMRTSKVIVAVNKDPDAPIFAKADFGVVADLFQVVPALTEEVKKLHG